MTARSSGLLGGSGRSVGSGLLGGLDALVHRAVQLVWLNLWWTLLTLRGGIVLGIGPAAVGAHAVASAWARGEQEVDVRSIMCARRRMHRRPAAAAGLLAVALLMSLALTWWLSRTQAPIPAAITQGLVLLAVLLLATTLPYLALVVERTSASGAAPPRLSHLFTAGLALGMSRPVLSLTLIAIWLGWPLLLVLSGWPGLLPVIGVGVPFAASAWCLERALPRAAPSPHDRPPRTPLSHDPLPAHDPAPHSQH
ncbi:DUF624 domain-containing protein, partial [Brachybacterium sp.]|uniref:DUF624 domain-containing protein n=1 Tax=Brachybacterium sp. TaxID=1891286 RepID=UPI002ED38DD9